MSELVHDMRAKCILAVRSPRDAGAMASVLQVISSVERIANDAVNITRIVTHRLGIPRELVADLSLAEEVSHRVLVREGSHMAHRPLSALELPVATGMRVMAIRRGREWVNEVEGDVVLTPGDVLFLEGPPAGVTRVRELANAPIWDPPAPREDATLTDLDRAVDVLVEMKNISEVAVGLAYSALVFRDMGLAAEVRHLEDRLDEMKDRLELWVLRAARRGPRPVAAAGSAAPEPGGRGHRRRRPGDGVAHRAARGHPPDPVHRPRRDRRGRRAPARGGGLDGRRRHARRAAASTSSPGSRCWPCAGAGATSTGPGGGVRLQAGDELIASGPDEGRELLAELLGWQLTAGRRDRRLRAGAPRRPARPALVGGADRRGHLSRSRPGRGP